MLMPLTFRQLSRHYFITLSLLHFFTLTFSPLLSRFSRWYFRQPPCQLCWQKLRFRQTLSPPPAAFRRWPAVDTSSSFRLPEAFAAADILVFSSIASPIRYWLFRLPPLRYASCRWLRCHYAAIIRHCCCCHYSRWFCHSAISPPLAISWLSLITLFIIRWLSPDIAFAIDASFRLYFLSSLSPFSPLYIYYCHYQIVAAAFADGFRFSILWCRH